MHCIHGDFIPPFGTRAYHFGPLDSKVEADLFYGVLRILLGDPDIGHGVALYVAFEESEEMSDAIEVSTLDTRVYSPTFPYTGGLVQGGRSCDIF